MLYEVSNRGGKGMIGFFNRTGARRTIPRDQWRFSEDGRSVRMAAGFEPKKIYEVVYRSADRTW